MKRKQYPYIDFINVISTIAVVFLHTNYKKAHISVSPGLSWFISCILQCVCSFAVPCFFMITGATLLDYTEKYDTKTYLKKRFCKSVTPFIFWSLMALLFLVFYCKTIQLENLTFYGVINSIIHAEYNENYWFFTTLFGVYLSIPILAYLQKETKTDILLYIAILSFVLNSALPDLLVLTHIPIEWNIKVSAVPTYLLYVIIGYIIHSQDFSKKCRRGVYCLSLIILLFMITYTIKMSLKENSFQNTLRSNSSSTLIIFSIGIFLFFKYNSKRFLKIRAIEKTISIFRGCTFGVYLTHWFVRIFLIKQFELNEYSLYFCVFGGLSIVIICFILIKTLKMIPFMKYVLP